MNIYDLAYNEEYKAVERAVVEEKGNVDMAVMGFSSKQTELLNGVSITHVKEVFKTLDDETKARVKKLEKHIWWCVCEGASLIWGFQQPSRNQVDSTKRSAFFDRARMLKSGAPGEVVRGTFKKK